MGRGSARRWMPVLSSRGAMESLSRQCCFAAQATNKINRLEAFLNNCIRKSCLAGAKSPLQLGHQIEPLPREGAVLLRPAAEMAVGGGALIDRLFGLQGATGVGRGKGR